MWIEQDAYEELGQLLSAARLDAKLTQLELAKRLRKPQSFISSYERGQRRIDLLEFVRIADAMKVNPSGLFAKIIAANFSGKGRSKRR